MIYKLVKAENRSEALEKGGMIIGTQVAIIDVRCSYAGNGNYMLMPVIEPADTLEEQENYYNAKESTTTSHP